MNTEINASLSAILAIVCSICLSLGPSAGQLYNSPLPVAVHLPSFCVTYNLLSGPRWPIFEPAAGFWPSLHHSSNEGLGMTEPDSQQAIVLAPVSRVQGPNDRFLRPRGPVLF